MVLKINNYKNKYDSVLFLGTGQIKYKEILKKVKLAAFFTESNFFYPEAKDLHYLRTDIRNTSLRPQLTKNYENIQPLYLRKSDAEENRQ